MSGDIRTLGELLREAAGERDELDLDGAKLSLTVCGGVLVDGRDLSELPARTVESLAQRLRERADGAMLDPARNDFIKLD